MENQVSETDGITENTSTDGNTPPEPPKPAEKDWETEASKWKGLSRKNEKALHDAQAELDKITKDRDSTKEERLALEATVNETLVTSKLHVALARAGVSAEDADILVGTIDPNRFIAEGKPSDEAIVNAAKVFARSRGTVDRDPDLGQKDDREPSKNPNDLIRAMRR